MSQDFFKLSPEERALRLTAFALGELSAAEAEEIQNAIAADAELAREYAQRRKTVELLRETTAMERKVSPEGVPLRFDAERREKLLKKFREPAPVKSVPRRKGTPWYVPMSAAALLIGLLAVSALLPMFAKAKARARRASLVWLGGEFAEPMRVTPTGRGRSGRKLLESEIVQKGRSAVPGEIPVAQNGPTVTFANGTPQASVTPENKPASAAVLPQLVDSDGDTRVQISGQVATEPRLFAKSPAEPPKATITVGAVEEKRTSENIPPAQPAESAAMALGDVVTNGESIQLRGFQSITNASRIVAIINNSRGASFDTNPSFGFDAIAQQPNNAESAQRFLGRDVAGQSGAEPAKATGIEVQTPVPTFNFRTSESQIKSLDDNELSSRKDVMRRAGIAPGARVELPALVTELSLDAYSDGVQSLGTVEGKAKKEQDLKKGPDTLELLSERAPGDAERNNAVNGRFKFQDQNGGATVDFQLGDSPRGKVVADGSNPISNSGSISAGITIPPGLARFGSGPQLGPQPQTKIAGLKTPEGVDVDYINDREWRDMSGFGANRPLGGAGGFGGGLNIPPASGPVAAPAPIAAGVGGASASEHPSAYYKILKGDSGVDAAGVPVLERKQMAQRGNPSASAELAKLSEELNQLQSVQDRVKQNFSLTEMDALSPRAGVVQVIEPAEASATKAQSLWKRIGNALSSDVERSAVVSVEQDMPDVGAKENAHWVRPPADPSSTKTESERIQSKEVLGKVVEKLKLNEAWSEKKPNGKPISNDAAVALLRKRLGVEREGNTTLINIRAKSDNAEEAARIANAVAETYVEVRSKAHTDISHRGLASLRQQLDEREKTIAAKREELERKRKELSLTQTNATVAGPSTSSSVPQPEVPATENAFSTFSLNVSDVSFKLAAASLEKGTMPEAANIRSEEFINAFDYRDPLPAPGAPLAFAWERARYPFAHNRDIVRFSIKTAAQGREAGKPLNIVLLLDNSGSMERADRVRIIQESLRTLAAQLKPQDKLSIVTFARTASLRVDGVSGTNAVEAAAKVGALIPEGGTNLEDALDLAYRTALRHYEAAAVNRIVLLTDGAANLGNVEPKALKAKVENYRKQGIALDCFGIGWEGYNDDLLEQLSRNGDGRYGFVNTPEEAATEFVGQLAGALRVAASDVKMQVEFNPRRVTTWRQIGYAKHQLTKEQFRDNKVDAAEIGAAESGNALYVIETNPTGEGPIATVRARFRIPQTSDYREHEWAVPFGSTVELQQSAPSLRLAASASAFSEWLASSPFASEVTTDRLLQIISGVPESYGVDPRPKRLEWMIRQAKSISGK